MFAFGPFDALPGDGVVVTVRERVPADPSKGYVPAYVCDVLRASDRACVGEVSVRIGDDAWLRTYAGHIGYTVQPEHRGHGFARRACAAIVPILRHHGLTEVWITVTPDNVPSRRTCEGLGATMVEIVDLPPDCDMYREGQRQKCRYRWTLG